MHPLATLIHSNDHFLDKEKSTVNETYWVSFTENSGILVVPAHRKLTEVDRTALTIEI